MAPDRVRKLISDLKQFIVSRGFTQKEAAEKLGVTAQRLNDWLQERIEPSADKALQIQEWIKSKARPEKTDKRKKPRKGKPLI